MLQLPDIANSTNPVHMTRDLYLDLLKRALTSIARSLPGYLIVDDFGAIPACRQAVHDYQTAHGITEPIHEIDWSGCIGSGCDDRGFDSRLRQIQVRTSDL
jgi:hypothetical protein